MFPEEIRMADLIYGLITLISVSSTLYMMVRSAKADTTEKQDKQRKDALRDQAVDTKLDAISTNVESVLKKVESWGTRITVLETRYDQLAKDVARLQEHCDDMFRSNVGGTD